MSIVVTIGSPEPDVGHAFADLVKRAPGNAFIDPAALRAARTTSFAVADILLAWDTEQTPRQLMGAWSMRRKSLLPGCQILLSPAYEYAFSGTPVLDPAVADQCMLAFLDAIARSPNLPKVLRLEDIAADSAAHVALTHYIDANGWPCFQISSSQRPIATADNGIKRSGSTRKKLRQDWTRLAGAGTLAMTNDREPTQVVKAFEEFLKLEAGSWKGSSGTALLSTPKDAAFARRFVADLAAEGKASVALLLLDERAIAAQVVLYSGRVAFTWKIAFDSEFAKYSPGMLLVDRISDELLSSGAIDKIDSCSAEKSFMAQLWTGRQPMVDLIVELAPRKSMTFKLAVWSEVLRQQLREHRGKLPQIASWGQSKPRPQVAAG